MDLQPCPSRPIPKWNTEIELIPRHDLYKPTHLNWRDAIDTLFPPDKYPLTHARYIEELRTVPKFK